MSQFTFSFKKYQMVDNIYSGAHINLTKRWRGWDEINVDEMPLIPQWVLGGKEDIKWEEVSTSAGQATSCLHHHSPTESFEPTSSPFSPYTLEMTSSEIYTLLVQETVHYSPWSICRKRDRRSNETIYGWNRYFRISILKYKLESSPEVKSILTEFGIT